MYCAIYNVKLTDAFNTIISVLLMKCKIMEIELEEVSCVANGSVCDLSTQSTSCIGKPNSQPEFRPKFGSTLDIHNFTLYHRNPPTSCTVFTSRIEKNTPKNYGVEQYASFYTRLFT